MHDWTIANIPDQTGRVAVVTGANTGLGYQTALALANAGADVILTARDATKGSEAVDRIRALRPTARVDFSLLDLASLASIADFADRIADDHDRIDVLINNAGVASPRHRLTTSDGFELQFGVNFLGHFALTGRLLPLLMRADAPRVVSLSSVMHKYGRIDLNDLMSEHRYSPVRSYSQSKLATLIFARELQRRSNTYHWNLHSIAVHPGVARTDISKSRPGQPAVRFNLIFNLFAPLFTGTAESGALPALYGATDPAVTPGGYYGPTGWGEIKGPPGSAKSTAAADDVRLGEELWGRAEQLTGICFPTRV